MAKRITKRSDDYSQWYLDVVKEAQLAEHSPRARQYGYPPNWNGLVGKHEECLRSDVQRYWS